MTDEKGSSRVQKRIILNQQSNTMRGIRPMTIFDFKPRSDAAVVRNLLREIEDAQESGASRQDLWRNLREHHDLKLSFDAFCVALKRARARARTNAGAAASTLLRKSAGGKTESHRQNFLEAIEEPKAARSSSFDMRIRDPNQASSSPRRNRIKTPRDFADVHKLDFSEFDDKFK